MKAMRCRNCGEYYEENHKNPIMHNKKCEGEYMAYLRGDEIKIEVWYHAHLDILFVAYSLQNPEPGMIYICEL